MVQDLVRLLETEQRLEERLRAARAEAALLVTRAQEAADRQDADLAAELEKEEGRLIAAIEAGRAAAEADIVAGARHQVAAYDHVLDDRITAVAETLLERLLT